MNDEPLPHELVELFAAERSAPVSDPSIRKSVRARLAITVGGAALGASSAAAGAGVTLGTAGKILAVIALVGGGTVAVATHAGRSTVVATAGRRVEAAPKAVTAQFQEAASPLSAVRADETTAPPIANRKPPQRVEAPAASRPAPVEHATPPTAAVSSPSEISLLHDAWLALEARDASRALTLVETDASLHADGVLAEERDALRVASLSALDRREDARSAATVFLVRYPNSIHQALVERALDTKDLP